MHNHSFDRFSINLPLFLRDGFRFVFACTKPPYSEKFSQDILNFCISCFSEVHNYTPDWLNLIAGKFLKNDKLFDLEIYDVKLKYTEINFIKAICGNPTLPFKMEIRLAYTEDNVCKDTNNHEL